MNIKIKTLTMKKYISLSIALFTMFTIALSQPNQNNADSILGIFWSPKKDAKIEIFKRGDKYFGKSIWSSSTRKDLKNPNESLRNRNLLGVEFLSNFIYNGNGYEDGTIYDPESGKTYDCKISFSGKNLKVRGYIGISLFGRTELFERVI